jgi:hypothetical protein
LAPKDSSTATTKPSSTTTKPSSTTTTAANAAITAASKSKDTRAVPFGAAISAEYHRKFEFDMAGSSLIRTKLVSVPAPTIFLDALKDNARNNPI